MRRHKRGVTVKDVADLAGVSTATVSRVLNRYPYVAEHTRARVMQAMKRLDYRPSQVARYLRTGVTQILGLIISDIANPYFTSIVRGIEDVAYANGYSLILCNSDEDPAREDMYIHVLLGEQVAGVILSPSDEDSTTCTVLIEAGIPVVAVDRRLLALDVDTVLVDNVVGAYEAVSHIVGLGHRRVGLIGGPVHIATGRERREGYERALAEHGIGLDEGLLKVGDFRQESGYQKTCELLEMDNPPTAIFVANNLMTLGALNAIHERGLRIPCDVGVVGFDDMPWASSLNPPLTAVAQPTYDLGRVAAELLLERLSDKEREVAEVVLQPNLIVRSSCARREP